MESPPSELPANVRDALTSFVTSAQAAFGDALQSVILFGSGAEGKLRPLSDVNVLVLLRDFDRAKADQLREPLRRAHAAILLSAMFLLETELAAAIEAFAVKFGDIARRRHVLYGKDPFAGIVVSRSAAVVRLRQILLNLTLRMREIYIARSLREEQLVAAISEMAGPLRACAATLLELQGERAPSPREALAQVAGRLFSPEAAQRLIERVSEARTERILATGNTGATFCELIDLAHRMWKAAMAL